MNNYKYQVMLDVLVSGEVQSDPQRARGDEFDTFDSAKAFAVGLGRGAWVDVWDTNGHYVEHFTSEDIGVEPVRKV
jgi:hypothetical protein